MKHFSGIMHAYALSLLTQRQLIVDMNEPCNFSKIFAPNKVNWLPSQHNFSKQTYIRLNCLSIKTRKACAYENVKRLGEDLVYFRSTDHAADIFYDEENSETKRLLKKIEKDILNIGVVKRIQDFTLKNLFHIWYKDLFRLEASLETKYNHIKQQAYLNHGNMIIYCAQIRIGGQRANVANDARFNQRNVTKLFWQFIRNNFIRNESSANDNWKLFVTSDLEEVEMEAISEFGIDKVIRIDGINSHLGREKHLSNDCTRVEKPILDFHFLQNCDKAVISKSGFGQLATWNREKPDKDMHVLGTNWREFDPDWIQRVKQAKKTA